MAGVILNAPRARTETFKTSHLSSLLGHGQNATSQGDLLQLLYGTAIPIILLAPRAKSGCGGVASAD